MQQQRSPSWRRWIAALVAFLAAVGGFTVAITDDPDHPPGKPRRTITVTVGPTGHKTKIAVPPAAQDEAREQAAEDAKGEDVAAHSDLHENAPPAADDLAAGRKLTPPGQPEIPKDIPLASAHVDGCTTVPVRNFSFRNGAPVLLGVIHWTGSAFGSGPGIVVWFDTPAAQASSNEIVDRGGKCWLTVPEAAKAWTQAGFNPWSVSVEIVNPGVIPLFADVAQRRKVIDLMVGWHHRWRLPYRRAIVDGCRVIRAGFLAHRDLGACGGGHPDVGASPATVDGLIRDAKARDGVSAARVTAAKVACRKLTWHRREAARARARHQPTWWTRRHVNRARELKRLIAAGHRVCPA